ncbi:MAG: hypothetical protein WD533_07460 [Dehalococcoidia bacterium]
MRSALLLAIALLTLSACVSQSTYDELEGLYTTLDENYTSLSDEHREATQTIEQLSREMESAIGHIAEQDGALEAASSTIDSLAQQLTQGEQLLETTRETVERVRGEFDELTTAVGTIEEQQKEIESLQDSITDLQRTREALVPQRSTAGFLCTGSMNPVITCLDHAVWEGNVRADDLVIGAVVSFTTDGLAGCNVSSSDHRIAHRIIGIQNETYLMKGDNNRIDDGCWVPLSHIDGYLIELEKGHAPEIEPVFDQVWALEQEQSNLAEVLESLSTSLDALRARYNDTLAEYEALTAAFDALCVQHTVVPGGCTLPSPYYAQAVSLNNEAASKYNDSESIRARLNNEADTHSALRNHYLLIGTEIDDKRAQIADMRCDALAICN